jgi:hypothetical protein
MKKIRVNTNQDAKGACCLSGDFDRFELVVSYGVEQTQRIRVPLLEEGEVDALRCDLHPVSVVVGDDDLRALVHQQYGVGVNQGLFFVLLELRYS